MYILTIRSDKPEAELGLFDGTTPVASLTWQAHRELAETIHLKIKELLVKQPKELTDLGAIVIYKGPGSFTGLRIGFSVANALASALNVPIVSAVGESWQKQGIQRLLNGENEKLALPEYGSQPHITQPKK